MTDKDSGSGSLNFEMVLDRIIEVTEKNLTMQSEFLKAIYELKGRFDRSDRDHVETQREIMAILNANSEIISKMKETPNEKIVSILEDFRKWKEEVTLTTIRMIDSLKDIKNQLCDGDVEEVKATVTTMSVMVKDVADSYKMVKRVLLVIASLVIGFQLIVGMFTAWKDIMLRENMKSDMEAEIRKVQSMQLPPKANQVPRNEKGATK